MKIIVTAKTYLGSRYSFTYPSVEMGIAQAVFNELCGGDRMETVEFHFVDDNGDLLLIIDKATIITRDAQKRMGPGN